METKGSEVQKIIYEGAEVYLNGTLLGNRGEGCEVETSYEEPSYQEAWHGEMGPSKPRPAKRIFKITVPEEVNPLRRDWIVKHYTQGGSIREATFSDEEEAQGVMQLFRGLDLEGHFELVCRPRVEEVVVTSYRNEPEQEQAFDQACAYSDRHGDEWRYEEEEWWCYQNGYRTFRAAGTPPDEYGPYTRIKKESSNE